MKLLAPITAIIAAASAGQVYHASYPAANVQQGLTHQRHEYQSQVDQYQGHPIQYETHAVPYQGHASQYHIQEDQYQSHPAQYQAQEGQYQGQAVQFEDHPVQYHGQNDQAQAYVHESLSTRPHAEKTSKILEYQSESDNHGYKYSFETENGIKVQEHGQAGHGSATQGQYSYKGDDGKTYTVSYTADENGFRVEGNHLPTPPPVPEHIVKTLEQNAKEEEAGVYDDGSYAEHPETEGHGYQSAHEGGLVQGGFQPVLYPPSVAHHGGHTPELVLATNNLHHRRH